MRKVVVIILLIKLAVACSSPQDNNKKGTDKIEPLPTFIDTLNGSWTQQYSGCNEQWDVCDTVLGTWVFQDTVLYYNDFSQEFTLLEDTLFISKEPYVMRKRNSKAVYLENVRTKNRIILKRDN